MAKIKVCTLSNTKINEICRNAKNCDNCPLSRHSKDGRRRILCYKKCRSLYLMDKKYHEELFKQNLSESEMDYHKAMWQMIQEEQMKLENEEIEL